MQQLMVQLDGVARYVEVEPPETLPEFAFSPKEHTIGLGRPWFMREGSDAAFEAYLHRSQPVHGPMVPPQISAPRKHGEKRPVGPVEEGWLNYHTLFDVPVSQLSLAPKGTAKPFLPESFVSREAEYAFLMATQHLDLPTVGQELAATGISSFSLSSSSDDDDPLDIDADAVERNASRYGTAYTGSELAPLMRRIEWERYIYHCGKTQKVFLYKGEDGNFGITSDDRTITPDQLRPYARKLFALLDGRTPDELENDRARVRHYGVLGSILYGVLSGEQVPEQSFDDLTDYAESPSDGPKEIGFESTDLPSDFGHDWKGKIEYDPNEPTETALWPITVEEITGLLFAGQALNQREQDWLDRNPEALDMLKQYGLVS